MYEPTIRWATLYYHAKSMSIFEDVVYMAGKYSLQHHLDFAEYVFKTLRKPPEHQIPILTLEQTVALASEYLYAFPFVVNMASYAELNDEVTQKEIEESIKYRNESCFILNENLLISCNQGNNIYLWLENKKDELDVTKPYTVKIPDKLIRCEPGLNNLIHAKDPTILIKYENSFASFQLERQEKLKITSKKQILKESNTISMRSNGTQKRSRI